MEAVIGLPLIGGGTKSTYPHCKGTNNIPYTKI
nr:MAG TPA: hypothetical protein [Caudoviricetes sp.]